MVIHLEPAPWTDTTICGRKAPLESSVHPERVTCKMCNATMDRMAITEESDTPGRIRTKRGVWRR